MLDFLGNEGADPRYRAAHDDILKAIEQVIAAGDVTRDMGASSLPSRWARPSPR